MISTVLPVSGVNGGKGAAEGEAQTLRGSLASGAEKNTAETPTPAKSTTEGTTETAATSAIAPVEAATEADKAAGARTAIQAVIEAQTDAMLEDVGGAARAAEALMAYAEEAKMNAGLEAPEPVQVYDGEVLDPVSGDEKMPFSVVVNEAA